MNLFSCFIAAVMTAQPQYDLLLRAGIIDPKEQDRRRRDVAIKTARLQPSGVIPSAQAARTVNAAGL